MGITSKELNTLAKLAHLELTQEERGSLTSDLNRIVEFVRRIADKEDPAASPSVAQAHLALAEDSVEPSLPREVALANAPHHTDAAVVAKPLETPGA